jgi:hypothetical protein
MIIGGVPDPHDLVDGQPRDSEGGSETTALVHAGRQYDDRVSADSPPDVANVSS